MIPTINKYSAEISYILFFNICRTFMPCCFFRKSFTNDAFLLKFCMFKIGMFLKPKISLYISFLNHRIVFRRYEFDNQQYSHELDSIWHWNSEWTPDLRWPRISMSYHDLHSRFTISLYCSAFNSRLWLWRVPKSKFAEKLCYMFFYSTGMIINIIQCSN